CDTGIRRQLLNGAGKTRTDRTGLMSDPPTETQIPPLSRRKLWTFRLAALGVSSLIGIAILVVFLIRRDLLVVDEDTGELKLQAPAIYVQEPGYERTGHRYLYDAHLGWRNIPDWSATTMGGKLNINSKGLRDREYEYAKPDGWRRILVLGDSFVWGYGVADDEIFTEYLERRFEKEGTKCEVLNTGVSGWGTDQELLYLTRHGHKFHPDLVVLAFYLGNDPSNNAHSIQYGLNKPVYMDLDLTLANVPVPKPPTDPTKLIKTGAERYDLTVRIIEEIAGQCSSIGAGLVVLKFGLFQRPTNPAALQAEAEFTSRLARIRDKLRYLDLDEAFEQR
ncbi:MAG: hypothetical protein HQ473_07770, partial [Cryomorphaceae bacterium]|nr:hypothetical protein [Cryomorphaceae bacterium]